MKAKRLNFLPPGLRGCQLSLNILMSISLNMLESGSERHGTYKPCSLKLKKLSTRQPYHQPTATPYIMYRAGQRSVVEYITKQMEN